MPVLQPRARRPEDRMKVLFAAGMLGNEPAPTEKLERLRAHARMTRTVYEALREHPELAVA